jgi:hypothetical protein
MKANFLNIIVVLEVSKIKTGSNARIKHGQSGAMEPVWLYMAISAGM